MEQQQSAEERLAEIETRMSDIRSATGVSLGQNALANMRAELERLEAERATIIRNGDES